MKGSSRKSHEIGGTQTTIILNGNGVQKRSLKYMGSRWRFFGVFLGVFLGFLDDFLEG